jgi:hypothetical protein
MQIAIPKLAPQPPLASSSRPSFASGAASSTKDFLGPDRGLAWTREGIPAAYPFRDFVATGGLMSYGTDIADTHQPDIAIPALERNGNDESRALGVLSPTDLRYPAGAKRIHRR